MKQPELAGLPFSKTTGEQFNEFFEANGFYISSALSCSAFAGRQLNTGCELIIWTDGELAADDSESGCGLNTYSTFGEALEAANKIAEVLGGWAE